MRYITLSFLNWFQNYELLNQEVQKKCLNYNNLCTEMHLFQVLFLDYQIQQLAISKPVSIDLRHTYIVRVYQELTFIHLSKCIQDSETHLIFQNKALLYQQCIQVSSDLRHTNIFRVYQKLTYIHVSAYIQGSKTQFIFQSMAVLYHQFIHVSKYPAI